jgi:hypothetical protein
MLHSRRKAEIEILSGAHIDGHDSSAPSLNNRDGTQASNNAEERGGDDLSIEIRPSTTSIPPALEGFTAETIPIQTRCNPHALLTQYLTAKITNCVLSASGLGVEH